jgi:hypothetical protein
MQIITIEEIERQGYTTALTLESNCFYCVFTDAIFPLESFKVENEYLINQNGKLKKLRTLSSVDFNLKGYSIE